MKKSLPSSKGHVSIAIAVKRLPLHDTVQSKLLAQMNASIRFVPKDRQTFETCNEAVKSKGSQLAFVPFESFTHEQCSSLCQMAVTNDGCSLLHVPHEYRTTALCLDAVLQSASAISFVPDHELSDAICIVALKKYAWAFAHIRSVGRTSAVVACAINEGLSISTMVQQNILQENDPLFDLDGLFWSTVSVLLDDAVSAQLDIDAFSRFKKMEAK